MPLILPARRSVILALLLAAGLSAGGCARRPATPDPATTGSIGAQAGSKAQDEAERWSETYRSAPEKRESILGYAQALRSNGQTQQAVEVLRRGILVYPKDTGIASAYGKALAANGDFDQALKVIRSANSLTTPDWRLLSAEGAILDQLGNPGEARKAYLTALKIAPEEPSVLNNLGLSYLLNNEVASAEATLRRAAASPRADSRVRQNFALALGLQGKFEEAEKVARAELSPEQAAQNLAYLRKMLAEQNTWKDIKQADRAKPRA